MIYVAKDSFVINYEGETVVIHKGVTRVREGHPIMDGREELFEPLRVHYDLDEVEQATARPGERRDTEAPDTRAMREWAVANGYEVPARRKLPDEAVQAYKLAHAAAPTGE